MRTAILFLIGLVFSSVIHGQTCACQEELDFVIQYYEKNLPGFKDNVNEANLEAYQKMKSTLRQSAQGSKNKVSCFKTLTYFVEFFKDNHSSIRMGFPKIDENDQSAVEEFIQSNLFQNWETIELGPEDLKQYPLTEIRGIYSTSDNSYKIAVIPSMNPLFDYVGVIVESKTALWKKGQVKLEIKKNAAGQFEAFEYLRNHAMVHSPKFTFQSGLLGDHWFKSDHPTQTNPSLNKDYSFYHKVVSGNVVYLRIPTFSGGKSAKIDSLYKAARPDILANPYLIVDVRNNGGGSDDNVAPLLDYIYTGPIRGDIVDSYVTAGNIKMWEKWTADAKADRKNYSLADIKWFENQVKKMKKAPLNSYIPRSKGKPLKRKVKKVKPKKVGVIANKNCASSCETLLFWVQDSDNTVLLGENSGGYVGYGEVGSVKTPCYNFHLYCTMTRYQEQRKYEVVGVAPDHYLSFDRDWIDQTIDIITAQ